MISSHEKDVLLAPKGVCLHSIELSFKMWVGGVEKWVLFIRVLS